MELRDGRRFRPEQAKIVLPPAEEGGLPVEYSFEDLVRIVMVEAQFDVANGSYAPPGATARMPIKGLRFVDTSDLTVEVPMPLAAARDVGQLLMSSKVEISRGMPSGLIVPTGRRPPK